LVKFLKLFKRKVCYDHLLSKEEIKGFGVKALDNLNMKMDGVIVAVVHDEFKKMGFEYTGKFMNAKPVIIDVRGMFDGEEAKN
jgi:UDP-N-acetyl-D-mannosaminuronate dehydrogenase